LGRTIFVYEFLTAGGCWSLGDKAPSGSLLAEGRAMRDALARDFVAMGEVESLLLMHDGRLTEPTLPKQQLFVASSKDDAQRHFQRLAAEATATVVIAPEFSQLLWQRVKWAEEAGAKLLSPASELVKLASDKQRTAEHLAEHGVRVPQGISFSGMPTGFEKGLFPAVLKPNDGCGSLHVRRVKSAADFEMVDWSQAFRWRLEEFIPGIAVSVAIIGGTTGFVCLAPCEQVLSSDGQFSYWGGRAPLPAHLAKRATTLAQSAAGVLPKMRGWIGIDMVLGSAENGASDFVIEINPRLTTSYIGLRRICKQNLAQVMWQAAAGETVELSYKAGRIEFLSDGAIREFTASSSQTIPLESVSS